MKLAPSTSASRPWAERRQRSIWKSRSCACTNPCAKNRSSWVAAWMCGTPHVSRTTRTGAERPSTFERSGHRRHDRLRQRRCRGSLTRDQRRRRRGRERIDQVDYAHGAQRRSARRIRSRNGNHAEAARADSRTTSSAWKPHEKSMALGELASHLGNIPNWGATILNDLSFDLAERAAEPDRRRPRAPTSSPCSTTRPSARGR